MSPMSTAADAVSETAGRSHSPPRGTQRELHHVGYECAKRGLVVARQGNISVRQGDVVHITVAGSDLGALTGRDVVSLDRGAPGPGRAQPSVEWSLHARIYEQRSDVDAILHTHSPYATAWSYLGEPLGVGSRELRPPLDRPILTAADAPAGSVALAQAAADALEDRSAVLLTRHGVVGTVATLAEALDVCVLVEHHARVAWLVRSSTVAGTHWPS